MKSIFISLLVIINTSIISNTNAMSVSDSGLKYLNFQYDRGPKRKRWNGADWYKKEPKKESGNKAEAEDFVDEGHKRD